MYFNELEVKKTIEMLRPNNKLFEIRIFTKSKNKTYSGYFVDSEVMLNELKRVPLTELEGSTICFTLNELEPSCYARVQRNKLMPYKSTTTDNDIINYTNILIDFDPKRPSGISSTQLELNKALEVRKEVYYFLKAQGFGEPTVALSGNGCHLLYRVNFPNTKENTDIIKKFLECLSLRFSNNDVEIDRSVFNPSRICKLYGTLAQKGLSTKERPHRLSKTQRISTEITQLESIKHIASMFGGAENKVANNDLKTSLKGFFEKHKIEVREVISESNYTKYILAHCPFNPEHDKDSPAIFHFSNGAIAYKCFHNGCSSNGWREFRSLYEPNYTSQSSTNPYVKTDTNELDSNIKYLYGFNEIETYRGQTRERVLTNIRELDKMLGGFTYDCVSLWASQTNGGKTTLLTMLTREFIKQGKRIFYFNGEQTKENFKNNLLLQNATKLNIKTVEYNNTGIFDDYVADDTLEQSSNFYNNHIFIYNNEAPRNIDVMIKVMQKARERLGIRDFIIDNLMQIDIVNSNDTLREQERLTEKLRTFAINTKSNVHLIAHSRKTTGSYIRLNLFDIAGSQNIANKSYNIITITRTDQLNTSSDEYERLKNDCIKEGYDIGELDSVLEVLKYKYRRGRTGLVGLKYIPETGLYEEVKKRPKREIEIIQAEREKLETLNNVNDKPRAKRYNY